MFQAFKEVEVAVRSAAKLGDDVYGVDLMSDAFKVKGGALTNTARTVPEQQATLSLFLGAVGAFRNPFGHRRVVLSDAVEAGEMISFASLLMRIVDASPKPS